LGLFWDVGLLGFAFAFAFAFVLVCLFLLLFVEVLTDGGFFERGLTVEGLTALLFVLAGVVGVEGVLMLGDGGGGLFTVPVC